MGAEDGVFSEWEEVSFWCREPWPGGGGERGGGEPDLPGPQVALESVHVIDGAGGGAVLGALGARQRRGPTARRFGLSLVEREHPGVRAAQLARDDQLGTRELKKYHLLTKQRPRRRQEATWLLLSPYVQRDGLLGGTINQDWQPYPPSESNLPLLAAKGLEWRVDSRTCSRSPPNAIIWILI
ncbi:hypothetical protein MC885_001232 [Smutsia gigantea]|nr:hypothetical protein MC885_001232 [Smutsia gigantea]